MKQTLQSDLHAKTGGVHIVGLFTPDGVVCIAEDIGRHNALDRVIGYGLLNNVSFSQDICRQFGKGFIRDGTEMPDCRNTASSYPGVRRQAWPWKWLRRPASRSSGLQEATR